MLGTAFLAWFLVISLFIFVKFFVYFLVHSAGDPINTGGFLLLTEVFNEFCWSPIIDLACSHIFPPILPILSHFQERVVLLENDLATAVNLVNLVSEKDEPILLEAINVKNSSIFHLDEFYKTLAKLYNKFDTMDGICQLAFSMVIQSTVILSCVYTLIVNLYGGYLLDRFQLESRYPKIAWIIKYRKKISKYYIISNLFLITLVC